MTESGVKTEFPPIIARHLPEIVALAKSYGVERLEVFGSVMTDRYDPLLSDVDFLVKYPRGYDYGPFLKHYQRFESDLAELLHSPVDLVMDSQSLRDRFRRNIAGTRTVLYDAG